MNKQNYKYRWYLLSFCIWIPMGNYYNYDIPTSLYNSFKTHLSSILTENEFEFYYGLLFSLTSFVNIFTPFMSGQFRDKYGNRSTLFLLLIFVSFGQFLFIEGFIQYNLYYIIIGRIFISIGIEPCGAIQTSLLSQYFKIDHIGFVVGLCELFASIGTISVMFLAPKLAYQYNVIIAIQSGSFAIAMSFVCCIVTVFYDINAEQHYQNSQQIEQETNSQESNKNYFSLLYWMVIIFNMMLYSTLLAISNFSVGIMTERWYKNDDLAEEKVGQMMGIMWTISSFLSPVFGYFLDKYKKRSIFNIFSSIFAFIGLIQLWYFAPFIAINFLGVSYAIVLSSVWSSIVFLVDEQNLGLGYAYVLSSCNFFLTILPLAISIIKIKTQSFFYSLVLLAFIFFLTIILSIIIYFIDKKEGNALDGLNQNKIYEIVNQNDL